MIWNVAVGGSGALLPLPLLAVDGALAVPFALCAAAAAPWVAVLAAVLAAATSSLSSSFRLLGALPARAPLAVSRFRLAIVCDPVLVLVLSCGGSTRKIKVGFCRPEAG